MWIKSWVIKNNTLRNLNHKAVVRVCRLHTLLIHLRLIFYLESHNNDGFPIFANVFDNKKDYLLASRIVDNERQQHFVENVIISLEKMILLLEQISCQP